MECNPKKINIGVIVGIKEELNLLKKFSSLTIDHGYKNNASLATQRILKKNIDVIISFGLAASINKKVKNGEIIIPKNILNEDGSIRPTSKKFFKIFSDKIKDFKINNQNLLGVSRIINTQSDNQLILKKFKKKVSFIDMESVNIQKIAFKNKVPFLVIRVILDDTSFAIPDFLVKCIDSKGNLIKKLFATKILQEPIRIISLIKLFFRFKKSKKVLQKISSNLFN